MKYVSALFILLTLSACGKESQNVSETDAFIFGHFFGECFGESCIEIYRLVDNEIYEDTLDKYPGINGNEFDWIKRTDVSVEQIAESLEEIPNSLFDATDQVIGMPDAGDWGGIYVQIHEGAEARYWLIDHADQNIPEDLVPFTTSIKNTIQLLQ